MERARELAEEYAARSPQDLESSPEGEAERIADQALHWGVGTLVLASR